ncbi:MAG: phosphatase PAP2 family protein [Tatlockia sp.]|jgi:hypothetical protein
MKIKWILTLTLLCVIALVSLYFPKKVMLPTYFSYSKEEMSRLNTIPASRELMTDSTLKKWDTLLFDLIKSNKIGDAPASRIYAYVYLAQRDAAFLSFNVKKQFYGSLDPITAEVLCLFFPKDCTSIKMQKETDSYSEALSDRVLKKINARIASDTLQQKLPERPLGEAYWSGVKPYYGQEVGGWRTWIISTPNQFLPAPPPKQKREWQAQLNRVQDAVQHITPSQTKAVVFWAGNPSTITPPGIWLAFANDYMDIEGSAFAKKLVVRSVLAMGIADAVISAFYAKYTYWVKRPFMLDSHLQTIMPPPNHPSYPAAHSVVSATAAVILSYYFPQNTKSWWQKAQEASSSRVWGGIHFPLDTEIGLVMGANVGETVIRAEPQFNIP